MAFVRELKGSLKLIFNYIATDLQKKPRAFNIGLFTVFLVATFLTALYSGIQATPAIFIKLAEDQAGDIDITLTPLTGSNDTRLASNPSALSMPLLNSTDVAARLNGTVSIRGVAPRWMMPAKFLNPDDETKHAAGFLIIINSQLEKDIGIGRKTDFAEEVLGPGEAWLTKSVNDLLKLSGI